MAQLFSTKQIAASLVISENYSIGAVVSSNGYTHTIENIEVYPSKDETGDPNSEQASKDSDDLVKGFGINWLNLMVEESFSPCYVANNQINRMNVELEKRKFGIIVESQHSDYVNVGATSYIASISHNDADSLLKNAEEIFPAISTFNICHSLAAIHRGYLLNYIPVRDTRAAIVYDNGACISIVSIETDMPVYTTVFQLKCDREDDYREIFAELENAKLKMSVTNFDLVIFVGNFNTSEIKHFRTCGQQVEVFNLMRGKNFQLGNLSSVKRGWLERDGHRFVPAIFGASMMLEGIGMNLTGQQLELEKELPYERILYRQETILTKATDGVRYLSETILPMLIEQKTILVFFIFVTIGLLGWEYWSLAQQAAKIEENINYEQKRATSLIDIRQRHEEYKSKIAGLKERADAINEIRKRQLTVRTILNEIDVRVPTGLVFEDLRVEDTSITIQGSGPDRSAILTFARRLGQDTSVFAEVTPIYDDKNNTGAFGIKARYVGQVPVNPIPLPLQQAAAVQK